MTASTSRPIVITMGDPSGVGPEVTVKALAALDAAERRATTHRRPAPVSATALSSAPVRSSAMIRTRMVNPGLPFDKSTGKDVQC